MTERQREGQQQLPTNHLWSCFMEDISIIQNRKLCVLSCSRSWISEWHCGWLMLKSFKFQTKALIEGYSIRNPKGPLTKFPFSPGSGTVMVYFSGPYLRVLGVILFKVSMLCVIVTFHITTFDKGNRLIAD